MNQAINDDARSPKCDDSHRPYGGSSRHAREQGPGGTVFGPMQGETDNHDA